MKTCKQCREQKHLDDFYKHPLTKDRRQAICKECQKEITRENRLKKADYYREYDKKRYQEDPRVRARHRRYQKTEEGREVMRKSQNKWKEKNAAKRAAHVLLGNAVSSGRVVKPDFCEKCGVKGERIHGHHDDYAKPLDVKWMCQSCHVAWHRENGEGKNPDG